MMSDKPCAKKKENENNSGTFVEDVRLLASPIGHCLCCAQMRHCIPTKYTRSQHVHEVNHQVTCGTMRSSISI